MDQHLPNVAGGERSSVTGVIASFTTDVIDIGFLDGLLTAFFLEVVLSPSFAWLPDNGDYSWPYTASYSRRSRSPRRLRAR